MLYRLKRRNVVTLLGGAVAASALLRPRAVRAQAERMRRIGVLMALTEDDPESKARLAAFRKALNALGWTEGKNLQIDYRWGVDAELIRRNAADLVALAPDLILANAPPAVLAVRQASRNVPIIFTATTDPVALGVVQSLARPGGNATGFTSAEFGMSAKWLELLKEIAPGVRRVGVFQEPSNPGAIPQFVAIQTVAPTFGVELTRIGMHDGDEIERDVMNFASKPNGGLIVTRTSEGIANRDLIVKLAARNRLPAVYPLRFFVAGGGLVSYGPDIVEQFRQAAGYIDRVLKGENLAELPVQAPTKYELVINLNTAKALGLDVPTTVLARADEVIE